MDNRKEQIIIALSECHGIVTDACRKTDVPRSTYYKWLNEDAEFRKAVEDTQEEAIDFVEGKLFQKINGVALGKNDAEGNMIIYEHPPSDTAIIFYLKTKAKKRGYVERTEVDNNHSGGIKITIEDAGGCDPIDYETKVR